jgi:DNA-binding NtrC family response regulator
LEIAIAMSDGDKIDVPDLRLDVDSVSADTSDRPPSLNLEQLEAWAIRQALRQSRSSLAQAARVLGIHRETLAIKLQKYGIDKES